MDNYVKFRGGICITSLYIKVYMYAQRIYVTLYDNRWNTELQSSIHTYTYVYLLDMEIF